MQIEAVRLNEEIGLVTDRSEDRQLSTRLHGLGKVVEDSESWGFDSLREHQNTVSVAARLCMTRRHWSPVNQSALMRVELGCG